MAYYKHFYLIIIVCLALGKVGIVSGNLSKNCINPMSVPTAVGTSKNLKNIFMKKEDFIIHACEQVLRFTQVDKWDDLSEERKVQLGFNLGVMALGLDLTKEEGFQALSNARSGAISMQDFREHLMSLIFSHKIEVNEENIARPF